MVASPLAATVVAAILRCDFCAAKKGTPAKFDPVLASEAAAWSRVEDRPRPKDPAVLKILRVIVNLLCIVNLL